MQVPVIRKSTPLLPQGISVIICTYNGASRIEKTLECLARQNVPVSVKWEIILIDNACTDNTISIAESYWVKQCDAPPLIILSEPRPGKNFAIKKAFKNVHYSYVCIVDDDNRLDYNYLLTGYSILEAECQIGLLGGRNIGDFEQAPPAWFSIFHLYYAVGTPVNVATGTPLIDGDVGENVLWGAGMFVRMALWNMLHEVSFNSLFVGRQGTKNLVAGEDDELCYVARMLGYEVWYSSKLVLQHYMTANRLNKAYRNRLFYSTAYSQTRTKIYRDILWGNQLKNYGSISNLLKDMYYMSRNVLKSWFSAAHLRAARENNELSLMRYKYQVFVLLDFFFSFKKLVKSYKKIYGLYERIKLIR